MDPLLLLAAVLFLTWPLQYRFSTRRIRARLRDRGLGTERFDRMMGTRRWFVRLWLAVIPVLGVLCIALFATDS